MSKLIPIEFDRAAFAVELADFRALLEGSSELSEAKVVLPFFRNRPNLSLVVSKGISNTITPKFLKHEMVLFGDYRCDLVVGDSTQNSFCFIEVENATKRSIFRPRKSSWEYSPRFERGFSQLVDWVYLIEDLRQTHRFEAEFGSDLAHYACLLVIGRDIDLTPPLRKRLRWREEHTLIASKKFYFMTFDELYEAIVRFIEWSKMLHVPPTSS